MATETVSINWPVNRDFYYHAVGGGQLGVDIKNWLLSEGMVLNEDFEYRVNTKDETVDVTFLKESMYITLMVLKFQGTK